MPAAAVIDEDSDRFVPKMGHVGTCVRLVWPSWVIYGRYWIILKPKLSTVGANLGPSWDQKL
eukprot:5447306-Karenia_brevis.AAC.1